MGLAASLFLALVLTLLLGKLVLHGLRRAYPALFYSRLPRRHLDLVTKYFTWYGRLGPQARRRFEHITASFMEEKNWRGVGIALQEEMQVMISASAAQLLFGLPDLTLLHFDRILVYADAYRHHRTGRMHHGEVNPGAGIIRLSWAHYLEGYARPADAHNVALHELAHALWFEEIIPNAEDDFFDPADLKRWKQLAAEEIAMIREGRGALFRKYAGTNQEEFFACAVEYFFERTADFKEEFPELYACMTRLLRQDPLTIAPVAAPAVQVLPVPTSS